MENPNFMPSMMNEGQVLPWYEVWRRVVTRPSVDTFRGILADPTAKPQRAFIWVAVLGLIFGVLQAVVYQVTGYNPAQQFGGGAAGTAGALTNLICVAIVTPILAVLGLAIGGGILRLVAMLLGGKGNFSELVYTLGAAQGPVSIVSFPISLISTIASGRAAGVDLTGTMGAGSIISLCLAPIGLAVAIYGIYMQVRAVETVEKFGTGKAVATVLIPVAVVILLVLCLVFGLAALFIGAANQ